jgi:hypothetical protein
MPFVRKDSADSPLLPNAMFMHCTKCVREWQAGKAPGESPGSYARINIAFDGKRLQAWCVRHDANIVTYEFVESYDFDFGEGELGIMTKYLEESGATNAEAIQSAKYLLEEMEMRGLSVTLKEPS